MQSGDLRIDVTYLPNTVRVDWRGKSNLRQPDVVLVPFFEEVTRRAAETSSGIEMHFEELEFFNSSTITAIIHYVKQLRTKQLRLLVSYDRSHKWQCVFFDALAMFERPDGLFRVKRNEVSK